MPRNPKLHINTGKRKRSGYSIKEFGGKRDPILETSRLVVNDCVTYVENVENGDIAKSVLDDMVDEIVRNESASSRKLRYLNDIQSNLCDDEWRDVNSSDDEDEKTSTKSYVIIDLQTFQENLNDIAVCKKCHQPLTIEESSARYGLGTKLKFSCTNKQCHVFSAPFNSTPKTTRRFDINVQLLLGARICGIGRSGVKKLLSIMNLGSPVNIHSWAFMTRWWEDISIDLRDQSCKAARLYVADITKLERQPNKDGSVNVSTGFDGSWKRRGWTSQEGFTSAVAEDTAQVVDVHHMVNNCRTCNKYKSEIEEGTIDQLSYLGKVVAHDKSGSCRFNHDGSPQSMESTGVIEMYKRSCDEKLLRYIPFIGDGDSSAYTQVTQLRPYGPGVDIPKDECHVHVVRRMGRALRKLNTDLKKGTAKNDIGDTVKSKGLTKAIMQAIINFYGLAIRNNKGDATAMSQAVWAILHHYKEIPDHSFCPVGHTSWCSYQKDVANGTSLHAPIKNPIPTKVAEVLTSLFEKLGSADFLKGCERVATQNPNESFNHVVWTMARKEVPNSSSETSLAINVAVGIFNDGFFLTMKTLEWPKSL